MSTSTARVARHGLVVAQVALAVTVVTAAGLLTRSLLALQNVDTGLADERLLLVRLNLPQTKYADETRHRQFLDELVTQLEAAPGIAGATPVHTPPFAGTGGWDAPQFTAEGQSAEQAANNPSLNLESIDPSYFQTLGVTLLQGRGFDAADRREAARVAIVSEDIAARTWPGHSPIGKRLKLGDAASAEPWRTIVGVARSTRYRELAVPRPTVYLPAPQFIAAAEMLILRASSPPSLVARAVRERVHAVDPNVQVLRVAPFGELLQGPLARPRFNAFVIDAFAAAALLLAAIGLYTVIAASVRQRYREVGIRIALGASPSDVKKLVLGEGLRLAALGSGIGLAAALAGTGLLQGLLFGIQPLDPPTLVAAVVLLIGVSAVAAYVPARRAVRMNPVALLGAD